MVGYEVRNEKGKICVKIALCKGQGEITGEIWSEFTPRMAQSLADDIYAELENIRVKSPEEGLDEHTKDGRTELMKFMDEHKGEFHATCEKKVKCGLTRCVFNKPSLTSLYEYEVLKLISKDDIERVCCKKYVGIDEEGKCFSFQNKQ